MEPFWSQRYGDFVSGGWQNGSDVDWLVPVFGELWRAT
jgi:hypothetical protein